MDRSRVLLVDGGTKELQACADELAHHGFDVTTRSSAEALRELTQGGFDVVLTDISMPGVGALVLIERMLRWNRNLPVVVLSGSAAADISAMEAVERGAAYWLKLPVSPGTLGRLLKVIISRSYPAREPRMALRKVAASVTASDAKNQFAQILEAAVRDGAVFITKHDVPRAVLLSVEEFEAIAPPRSRLLDALSSEFDALLARMQEPGSRERTAAAFAASPEELSNAAVEAARTRE